MAFTTRNEWGPTSSSSLTTGPWLVEDARTLSVSIVTASSTAANVIQMSDADGLTAAIPANSWSTVSSIALQGTYIVEPGARWLRVLRSESSATIIIQYLSGH